MQDYESAPPPEKQTGLIVLVSAGVVALCVVVAGVTQWVVRRSTAPVQVAERDLRPLPAPTTPAPAPRAEIPAISEPTPPPAEAPVPTREEPAGDLLTSLRRRLAAGEAPEAVQAALIELAGRDPLRAVTLAETIGRSAAEKFLFVSGVIKAWALNDPKKAWDWSLQQGRRLEVPGEPSLIAVTLETAATRDPRMVVETVKSLLAVSENHPQFSPQEVSYFAIDSLIKAGQVDTARAALDEWLQTNVAEQIGNASIERLAIQIADQSPQQAASWIDTLPQTEGRNFAAATLAATWAGKDPQAAIAWASSLDQNGGRLDAMQRAFNRWAENDMLSAAKWIEKNESDPHSDRLIYSFVNDSTLPHNNPKAAIEWAELINDDTMRTQSVEQVAAVWAATDSVAARRYVNESTILSAEQKQRLLQNFSTPR